MFQLHSGVDGVQAIKRSVHWLPRSSHHHHSIGRGERPLLERVRSVQRVLLVQRSVSFSYSASCPSRTAQHILLVAACPNPTPTPTLPVPLPLKVGYQVNLKRDSSDALYDLVEALDGMVEREASRRKRGSCTGQCHNQCTSVQLHLPVYLPAPG